MSVARFAAGRPRLIIALHLALLAAGLVGVGRLRQTDDLLEFVPAGNEDVRAFREISKTFGALELAVIGIAARPGDDIFAPDVLERIDRTSKALKAVRGVDRVVSLATLPDFAPSEAMVQINPLIDLSQLSQGGPAARAALKARVMSRDHVVGNFVARDGTASVMLVYLAGGVSKRVVANEIRTVVLGNLGDLHAYFGGGPYAQGEIFDETEADIRLLTPIAALMILGVILVAFRDPVGVGLALFTVAWASVIVLGVMGFMNEPFTMISGTLPVILFASGSSYAVHVLGRYYADGGGIDRDAPGRATDIVTPPVAIAGLTTAAGFISFVAMDIAPMRAFGIESAAGVLLCLFSSLTVVPAVISLWPRKSWRPIDTGRLGDRLAALTTWAQKRRVPILVGALLLGLATVGPMLRVDVQIDPRGFVGKDSDPAKADRFLDERFGGSRFVQVDIAGDLTDPATLDEVERLAEFARAQPGVTQVASIIEPLELVNDAMGGGPRLPESRAQAANLLFFLEGEPSLRNLLSASRDEALVHIRVRGDVHPVLDALEQYVATTMNRRPGAPSPAVVAERLGWIARVSHATLAAGAAERAVAAVLGMRHPDLGDAPRAIVEKLLDGDGGLLAPVTDPAVRAAIVKQVLAGEDARAQLVAAAGSPEDGAVAWQSLDDQLHLLRRDRAVAAGVLALGAELPPAGVAAARGALADLLPASPIATAARPIVGRVSGEPVLSRGFSRSVATNQKRALVVSLVSVLLLMFILFRSAYLAFASVLPSALWMAALFGAMGIAHFSIDISTSLVASIATGAGSDFAMHYLWYFKRRGTDEAVRFVGPIMVISALLVSSGFACLALGHSRVMRTFGGLAAVAMLGAFALTFLLVPALLRRSDISRVEGK